MITIVILSVSCFLLLSALIVTLVIANRYQQAFHDLEASYNDISDVIEESIRSLNSSRNRIVTIAGFEVASDEPYVRRVVEAINDSHKILESAMTEIKKTYGEEEIDD